ncbi:cobalamin biosynthesis protein CobW [Ahrensia sp. R2A130]|uniref:cobalamin biosynthesis protein CobW n=1 Tax=Ahrensia sp. R2A130 TaxID=744979 RepID=UPI0001E0AC6D|nr:cobalamin biosynthesis protein CobW [Ahrensia sp. R2A130]EFL90690.1 cobalamin biosynthesis protein CobW [Ahrensia sp. R2A130]
MDAQKIPATVITGFLGAGKTTLIRNLLATANGKRIALIINEFGDLGVDGDVLAGCGDETCTEDDIVELTNGCICCTVVDDFIPTITKLMESDRRPDHIVIETSGLALPQPLVNAFNWPEIREQVTVDGVVTVVDSAAVAAGRFAHDHDAVQHQREADESLDHDSPLEELFEDQINCADLIVLNKTDLLPLAAMAAVEHEVMHATKRKPKMIRAGEGSSPSAAVLLGLGVGSENDMEARLSHHELHHADGHEHDHDDFESFVVSGGAVADVPTLKTDLAKIIEANDVLRLKGFVEVSGKSMRLVVQAVGNRIDTYFDRDWQADEQRGSRLVVIGQHDMDATAINAAVQEALS